jgi:hypothetical protein
LVIQQIRNLPPLKGLRVRVSHSPPRHLCSFHSPLWRRDYIWSLPLLSARLELREAKPHQYKDESLVTSPSPVSHSPPRHLCSFHSPLWRRDYIWSLPLLSARLELENQNSARLFFAKSGRVTNQYPSTFGKKESGTAAMLASKHAQPRNRVKRLKVNGCEQNSPIAKRESARARTEDPLLKREMLYRLSYGLIQENLKIRLFLKQF